jgi:hypothetical protein
MWNPIFLTFNPAQKAVTVAAFAVLLKVRGSSGSGSLPH